MIIVFTIFLFGLVGLSSAQEASTLTTQNQWDERYRRVEYIYGKEPVRFLKKQVSTLGTGKALCLAAGEGRNAVFLAQQGFEVVAGDISSEGLKKCALLAQERDVEVKTEMADLATYDMGHGSTT
jgi:2-polyprenyl-3-methyl-5-hydroxy-6-metoxy-1,4-benzoquinol methylase